MKRLVVGLLAIVVLFVSLGAGNLQLQAQDIEWMDSKWVAGAKLETAEAVVIAFDTSGSIQAADRLSSEKMMAISVLNVLIMQSQRNPMVAVYSFESDVRYIIPPTQLSDLDVGEAMIKINQVQDTDHLTWLSGAIDEACTVTRPVRPAGTLVLMTDGKPTTADRGVTKNVPQATDAAYASAENFKEQCSTLAVIGIDVEGADEEFLRSIASSDAFLAAFSPGATPPPIEYEVAEIGPAGEQVQVVLRLGTVSCTVDDIESLQYSLYDAAGALRFSGTDFTIYDSETVGISIDTTGLPSGETTVDFVVGLTPFTAPAEFSVTFEISGGSTPSSIRLEPGNGITFAQVDFTWSDAPVQDSATGQAEIDPAWLQELGIASGFVNVVTRLGWVVQNLPAAEDFPYSRLSAMFQIAGSNGTDVTYLDAYVLYSSEPLTQKPRGTFSSFPVGTVEFNARGFGEEPAGPPGPPIAPLPGVVQFNLGGILRFCWQPGHTNVEAAENQCAPAAAANSLDWLRTAYGQAVPHPHVPGLRPDGSLVGTLCRLMNRVVAGRCNGGLVGARAFLEGKLCYIAGAGLNLVVKHQGALGAANFAACDRVSLGQGAIATAAFIVDEVCEGEDVELAYEAPCWGHMVQLVGAGYILGRPWIAHRSDLVQCNDRVGTAGTQFTYLADTDGDGRLNLTNEPGQPNVAFVCTESIP